MPTNPTQQRLSDLFDPFDLARHAPTDNQRPG
jgi:hypothetical protein